MAHEERLETISVPASGDLSSHQFKLVQLSTAGEAALANATSEILGILQNKPDAQGKAASIATRGVSKCYARSTIAAGQLVTSSTVGIGTAAVASSIATPCIGRTLEAVSSTANLIVPVLIDKETLIR